MRTELHLPQIDTELVKLADEFGRDDDFCASYDRAHKVAIRYACEIERIMICENRQELYILEQCLIHSGFEKQSPYAEVDSLYVWKPTS